MKKNILRLNWLWLLPASARAAGEMTPVGPPVTASSLVTVVILVLMNGLLIAILWRVARVLGKSSLWSLPVALSEGGTGVGSGSLPVRPLPPVPAALAVAGMIPLPAPLPKVAPVTPGPAGGNAVPPPDSSSSRLIAFIGMLVTVVLFFGCGNWVLWQCFRSGVVPAGIERLIWFLGSGTALFVPYALNQMRGALEEFAKIGRQA